MSEAAITAYTGALDWIAEALTYKRERLICAARGLATQLNDLSASLRVHPDASLPIEEIRSLADQIVDQAIAIQTLRGVRMVAQAEADGRD
ncbi:MAG: hypothetical protein ACRDZO_18745 [Egibacteraceae bacterium]